jgi:antitoxin MazE
MKTRVICRGGETAVVIPEEIAAERQLGDAAEVDVEVCSGRIVISTERERSLKEMILQITPENRHDETDWGPPVGKEIW